MGTLDLIPPGKGIGDLDPFLSTFSSARPLLVSDYDGTLAPFRRERGEALPGEHIRSLLMEIAAEGGEIVVLSGRRAEEVALLLDLPLEIWGSHGWERRTAGGRITSPPLSRQNRESLKSLRRELSVFPEDALEFKPISCALHWRGRPEVEELYALREEDLASSARKEGFQVLPFSGGVEFRLPLASKRTAMESILNGRSPRDPVCYLGDDLTDEDAFEALRGRGLGVLVADKPRPSAAQMWIAPSSVTTFLALWRDELKGKEESIK